MSVQKLYDFLREHGSGATQNHIADSLRQLVEAVVSEDRSGSLTINIKIKPAGNSGALEVSIDHKIKKPEPPPGVSIFFPTPEGNLSRQDPRQMNLDGLREVVPEFAFKGVV